MVLIVTTAEDDQKKLQFSSRRQPESSRMGREDSSLSPITTFADLDQVVIIKFLRTEFNDHDY